MCLQTIFTDEETEEWLAEQPEVLVLHKGVFSNSIYGPCFSAMCRSNTPYKSGFNKAHQEKIGSIHAEYWSGFHFYTSPAPIDNWVYRAKLECLVKKEWVTAIGLGFYGDVVVVASQAVFPIYPETEARYEDLPQEEVKEKVAVKK